MSLLSHSFVMSLVTTAALASSVTKFSSRDFAHAESIEQNGQLHVRLTFSPQGQKKMSELNRARVGQKTSFRLAGKDYHWILREPIAGPNIEAGPVSAPEVQAILTEVNSPR